MRKYFVFILFFLLFSGYLFPEQSVQTVMLHNDGYMLFQEFRPNDNNFKIAIREMEELAIKHKNKTFSESAAMIGIIQKKCKYYYDTNNNLVEHLKKKWSQPHYAKMDDEWKQPTFEKDRNKVKDVHSLTLGLQQAYNDWNSARNKAVRMPTEKEIVDGIMAANGMLKKTIDAVLEEEPKVFESISKELQIIKMSK